MSNSDAEIKIKAVAEMNYAFYIDFMPMIKQVQNDVATLQVNKEDVGAVEQINQTLANAEKLLINLKRHADKVAEIHNFTELKNKMEIK